MLSTISRQEFDNFKKNGFNRIPLVLECFADLDTPLSVYSKLANDRYSYLLESADGGNKHGRYSIIGLPAKVRIQIKKDKILVFNEDKVIDEISDKNPLDFIDKFMDQFKAPQNLDLPRFSGGLAGYFGYETIQYIEPRLSKEFLEDKLDLPDILLMLSDEVVVFDNVSGKLYFVIYVDVKTQNAYEKGILRLNALEEKLKQGPSPYLIEKNNFDDKLTKVRSEFGEENYLEAVEKVKEYIVNGDIMQVVLSQRLSQTFKSNPLSLYRTLRNLNPSPYMYFLHLDEFHIVGASPEILVRLEDSEITLRPLAGTRKRGKDNAEDRYNQEDLLNDPKEIAEHLMLIDLGRNDVGRVSEIGSVNVTDKMVIEKYSHVMHIVSNVIGKIASGLSYFDVLKAALPAGTLSGAPKIRAMEIINELEPSSRGIYGGAIGYIGWNGNMDTAIAIRTAVIKDQVIHVGAGAGIVADSIPENEWLECRQKSKVFMDAMEMIS